MRNVLGVNSYTIYNVKPTQLALMQTQAIWMDNCRLLLSTEDTACTAKAKFFEKYLETGGKILSLPNLSNQLDVQIKEFNGNRFAVYSGEYFFEQSYKTSGCHVRHSPMPLLYNEYIYSFSMNSKDLLANKDHGIHWISKICPILTNLKCLYSNERDSFDKYQEALEQIFRDLLTQEMNLKRVELGTDCQSIKSEPYTIISKNQVRRCFAAYLNISFITPCQID